MLNLCRDIVAVDAKTSLLRVQFWLFVSIPITKTTLVGKRMSDPIFHIKLNSNILTQYFKISN